MPRIPGSQSRAAMREKARLAVQLHEQGLTFRQISAQLNCSKQFVSKTIAQHRKEQQETRWEGVEQRSGRDRRTGRDRRAVQRTTWDRRSGFDRRGHPFYQPRQPERNSPSA